MEENGKLMPESAPSNSQKADLEASPEDKHGPRGAKLTLLPLIALIFYEVSGGPYGVEDSVKNGGPALAILGFLIFPFGGKDPSLASEGDHENPDVNISDDDDNNDDNQ
eukprot:jgi/Mesen1/8648/ME000502S08014